MMTVEKLIADLKQMNPQAEVRLATAPRWPFEHEISGVAEVDNSAENAEAPSIVYVGEGRQVGYLPGRVGAALDWNCPS